MPTLNLYLVRHGQTEFNEAGRIQGWCDSPLTATGKAGAAETGRQIAQARLHFDAAFCSTSPRTHDTARIILQNANQAVLPITPLAALREYHFGGFEGQSAADIHARVARERGFPDTESWLHAYRHGSRNLLAETVSHIDPNRTAESEEAFLQRLQTGLAQAVAASPCNRDANILIVSHGMAITAILKRIDPASTLYRSVPNASITHLRYTVFSGLQLVGSAGNGLHTA